MKGNEMHLRYDIIAAPSDHPQKVMRDLGISYIHATPQSMGDQWWFWCCENVPNPLPEYLEVADWNPHEMIGFGLSEESADKIAWRMKEMKTYEIQKSAEKPRIAKTVAPGQSREQAERKAQKAQRKARKITRRTDA